MTLQERWISKHKGGEWRLAQALQGGFSLLPICNRDGTTKDAILLYGEDVPVIEAMEDELIQLREGPTPPVEGKMQKPVKTETKGSVVYALRKSGNSWAKIASQLSTTPSNACHLAKQHCKSNKLTWPV